MNEALKAVAQKCLQGAETGSMNFPDVVGTLIQAGVESYRVDFRRSTTAYYLPDGDSVELPMHRHDIAIGEVFDVPALQAAIKEAQQMIAGYSYQRFCEKVMAAGCAGYIVSFLGKRVLYFGRSAETHTEHFPQ